MDEPKHFPRMVHPDDRPRVHRSVQRSDETGVWDDTYRILRRDGEIRWLHSFGRRTSAAGVIPELWHGIAIDVTAYRAEAGADEEVAADDAVVDRAP
jgi:PAS domain S-box-containing protein